MFLICDSLSGGGVYLGLVCLTFVQIHIISEALKHVYEILLNGIFPWMFVFPGEELKLTVNYT